MFYNSMTSIFVFAIFSIYYFYSNRSYFFIDKSYYYTITLKHFRINHFYHLMIVSVHLFVLTVAWQSPVHGILTRKAIHLLTASLALLFIPGSRHVACAHTRHSSGQSSSDLKSQLEPRVTTQHTRQQRRRVHKPLISTDEKTPRLSTTADAACANMLCSDNKWN